MNKIYGKIKGDNNNTCKSHKYSKCFCVTGFGLFFKIQRAVSGLNNNCFEKRRRAYTIRSIINNKNS